MSSLPDFQSKSELYHHKQTPKPRLYKSKPESAGLKKIESLQKKVLPAKRNSIVIKPEPITKIITQPCATTEPILEVLPNTGPKV